MTSKHHRYVCNKLNTNAFNNPSKSFKIVSLHVKTTNMQLKKDILLTIRTQKIWKKA